MPTPLRPSLALDDDAVAWLYLRMDDRGNSLSVAVQFVSLKPDLIQAKIAVH